MQMTDLFMSAISEKMWLRDQKNIPKTLEIQIHTSWTPYEHVVGLFYKQEFSKVKSKLLYDDASIWTHLEGLQG